MRYQGSFGIIEHDAFFLVEPALILIDLGYNRLVTERQNLVPQLAFYRVEHFPFPGKNIHTPRNLSGNRRGGRDDRDPFSFADRNVSGLTIAKNLVELIARHFQEL